MVYGLCDLMYQSGMLYLVSFYLCPPRISRNPCRCGILRTKLVLVLVHGESSNQSGMPYHFTPISYPPRFTRLPVASRGGRCGVRHLRTKLVLALEENPLTVCSHAFQSGIAEI